MSAKLRELLNKHEHFTAEAAKMRADATAAEAAERRILEDGLVSKDEVRDLGDARGLRELIARRLPIVIETKEKLGKLIEEELRTVRTRYNKSVCTVVEAKQAEIIEANRPFWQGDLRRLKKEVEEWEIPAVREIRRALSSAGFENNANADFWAGQARAFLDLSARHAKALNLSLE